MSKHPPYIQIKSLYNSSCLFFINKSTAQVAFNELKTEWKKTHLIFLSNRLLWFWMSQHQYIADNLLSIFTNSICIYSQHAIPQLLCNLGIDNSTNKCFSSWNLISGWERLLPLPSASLPPWEAELYFLIKHRGMQVRQVFCLLFLIKSFQVKGTASRNALHGLEAKVMKSETKKTDCFSESGSSANLKLSARNQNWSLCRCIAFPPVIIHISAFLWCKPSSSFSFQYWMQMDGSHSCSQCLAWIRTETAGTEISSDLFRSLRFFSVILLQGI